MKRGTWIVLGVLLIGGIVGCVSLVDPLTGETLYGIAPGVADTVDTVAGGVESVGPAVVPIITAINPVAGGIAAVVLGILGSTITLWKKWRTPLVSLTNKYDKAAAGARAAADVIETIVKPNSELWEKARPVLRAAESAGATMPDKL